MRRVVLYSHDTMGLGHLRRNLLIAQQLSSLTERVAILLISGVGQADAFVMPAGVDCLSLPSLRKEDGTYTSRSLGVSTAALVAFRSRMIHSAIDEFDPDVMIVDKVPRGVLRELDPTLAFLRKAGRTQCVLGLRDVLDDPATVQSEWRDEENEQAIGDFYDAIWVYGDPTVYDVVREYGFSDAIASKLQYTGYLDPRLRLQSNMLPRGANCSTAGSQASSLAVCLVGGGEDGARLASTFAQSEIPTGMEAVILSGPFMPAVEHERLCRIVAEKDRLRVTRFIDEPLQLLQRANRVIAMGGYNTVCEVLCHRKHVLVVPRVRPRREQWIRATRLEKLGLLDVLHPDHLTAARLTNWLTSDSRPAPLNPISLDFDGLNRLTTLFELLLRNSHGVGVVRDAAGKARCRSQSNRVGPVWSCNGDSIPLC